MAQQIDTRHPIQALDFDTEDRLLPKEHYRYGRNGRSGTSDQNNVGGSENIRGNMRRDTLDVSVLRRVIGSTWDLKNNAIVQFIYQPVQPVSYVAASVSTVSPLVVIIDTPSIPIPVGSVITITQGATSFTARVNFIFLNVYTLVLISGTPTLDPITAIDMPNYHHIRRYFIGSETFEYITNPALMGPVLNFSITDRIYNPRIIDSSFGQLLTWVVNPNGVIRQTNMTRMKEGAEYYNIANDVQYIDLYKRPPVGFPTFVYDNDSSRLVNFVTENFYQFSYRYIYDDNNISVCSMISNLARFPGYSETAKNKINLAINSGHKRVRKIEVLVRTGNGVSETGTLNPNWHIFATLDKIQLSIPDNIVYTLGFYGDEQLRDIATLVTTILFDTIPDAADHTEVVENNQIVAASITEGRDNIKIDCEITPYYVPIGSLWDNTLTSVSLPVTPSVPLQDGDFVFFDIIKPPRTKISYILQAGDMSNYPNSLGNALATFLTAQGIPTSYSSGVLSLVSPSSTFFAVIGTKREVALLRKTDDLQYLYYYGMPGFKSGSTHKFGIVYYDENLKNGGVQTDNSLESYVRFFTEVQQVQLTIYEFPNTPTPHGFIPRFNLTINHRPPAWAKYYSIVYGQNNIENFVQVLASDGASGGTSINSFTINSLNPYPFIDFKDIKPGDRVRGLSQAIPTEFIYWTPYSIGPSGLPTYADAEVETYDLATQTVSCKEIPGNLAFGGLVEIYRKRKIENIFFEFGHFYEIGDYGLPTAYHKGNVQNQNVQTNIPAIINITEGDVYYRNRPMKGTAPYIPDANDYYLIESNSLTDSSESNFWNKGRPQIKTPTQKQQKIGTLMRWGNSLINNTEVNNLATWDDGNYNSSINARYGDITGMRQIGYTLRILQWGNLNSAFIGRREVQNADASTQLVLTDNLIGTINPSEQEFGTKDPGSVVAAGDYIYFYDRLKAMYLRSASNGIFPISDYFMKKYWRDKTAEITSGTGFEIISGFDFKFKDLYTTILSNDTNSQETLYFNEDQNAWKYFVDMEYGSGDSKMLIDWYSWVGQSFFASMNGTLWQFNALEQGGNPVYSSLFRFNSLTDPINPFVVETIGMLEPDKVKIFLSHGIHSNLPIKLVEFFIPPDAQYPNGMYTKLFPGNYQYREGVFYANIKRDAYTKGIPPNPAAESQQIANGRVMRGHVIKVRITFETTEFVRFFSTGVGMIPSELS